MKKIAIVGSGGSGKSRFARLLSAKINIPVHHLDNLFWNPGWVKTPKTEWVSLQQKMCANEQWIIDGNYNSTIDIRLAAADTVIFLDVNRYLCIYRAIKRVLSKKSRPDMADGCEERIDWDFFKFLWKYQKKVKPNLLIKLGDLKGQKRIVILNSNSSITSFLNQLKQTTTN